MTKVVLDASALLALIHGEPGQQIVAHAITEAAISSVNLSEVVAKLSERGVPPDRAKQIPLAFGLEIIPFHTEQAVLAGQLRASTRALGLSLGERCCLATAMSLNVPVLTTDMAWETLTDALGLVVHNIRPRSH
jgi:PIN domain nuclease of toxin-antitoxin system